MSKEAKSRTTPQSAAISRDTWADWFPDEELTLTIDDVIARVRLIGVEGTEAVTVDKVRFWQRERVLPAPIRRKLGRGTGKARALYPEQAVNVVLLVSVMQHKGVRLRQMNDLVTRSLTQLSSKSSISQDPALLDAVTAAAARQEQRVGSPIRQVEVTFIDDRDRKHSHVFALDPDAEQEQDMISTKKGTYNVR